MNKKLISMIALIMWSILLVVGLSFGTDISKFFSSNAADIISKDHYKVELEDVNIINKTDYVIKNNYKLEFDINPKYDYDSGLLFQSLNEDIFKVDENGIIKGIKDGTGILKITSSKDKDFSKEIELNFIKQYPNSIEFNISNYCENILEAYVGVPIYFNYSFSKSTNKYSETNVKLIYDEQLFTKVNNVKYIPIKECENTTIKCVLGNGLEKEINFSIKSKINQIEDINKVSFISNRGEFIEEDLLFYVNEKVNYKVINSSNEILYSNYKISAENKDVINIDSKDKLTFKKAGDTKVTITLENGISKTYNISVRNIIEAPIFNNELFNKEGIINIKQFKSTLIEYTFSNKVTYKEIEFIYNEEVLELTNIKNGSFEVYGKRNEDTEIKIIINDGYTSNETTIKIRVNYNSEVSPLVDSVSRTFNKVAGHMMLFFVEAILALWMLSYYKTDKKWLNIFIFIGIGLFLGSLTEIIQIFIPDRGPKITDVLIDMSGYLLGFLVIYLIYFIKKNKNQKIKNCE